MFDWLRTQVLRVMRVPRDPEPPLGAPGSVRVFRAGRNFYKLRLVRWGLAQTGAVVGIAFSLFFLAMFRDAVNGARFDPERAAKKAESAPPTGHPVQQAPAKAPATPGAKRLQRDSAIKFVARSAGWVVPLFEVLEVGGILVFLAQIPVTLAAVRLEFELHWYIVTDRSLRIRTGLFRLQESTMSFANLQQVEVEQGPLQRLLGLADVRVQSAGGGGRNEHDAAGDSLHTGVFQSVDNATEIRDLILARLRQFRQAGLGDPDDHAAHAPDHGVAPSPLAPADALAAAREVLAEARALRAALS